MALFYLLIFLLLLFGLIGGIVYFFTDLADRLKWVILSSLIAGWLLVAGYSYYQNKERIYHDMLYYNYTQGKILQCLDPYGKKVAVDKKHFDFVSGTMVFVGKGKFEGLVVPLEQCKVRK